MVSSSNVLERVAKFSRLEESEGHFKPCSSLQSVNSSLLRDRAEDRKLVHHRAKSQILPAHLLLDKGALETFKSGLCLCEVETLQLRLRVTRFLKCSDPRDRVFALLGPIDSPVKIAIVPDYTKMYQKVYCDVAKAMAPFGTLGFLCSSGMGISGSMSDSSRPMHIPSWVTDWHLAHSNPTHPKNLLDIYDASLQELDTTCMAEVQDDGRVLSVKGYFIDAVDLLLPTPFSGKRSDEQVILKAFPVSYANTTKEERTTFRRERIRDLGAPDLMLNAYSDKEISDDDDDDGDGEEDENGDHESSDSCGPVLLKGPVSGHDFDNLNARFREAVTDTCQSRRFLRTREGRMVLGPGGIAAGDVVCIVLQCSTPLVLRQDPTRDEVYLLVGACYVHGVMYGEAISEPSEPSTILLG
ncbi:hypothetical protein B0H63DRAFT_518937 [Podospora didyma]|uniref:Uncharacterized protein n=1 Tax=Podospora didyma TaxID=330526 RepID=A0AAE0NXN9_9PEZI|nr:hypothetical protein B0H63DRAFT_518937 [Podospora didyma]